MADIVLICPGCKKETKVSEYAAEEPMACPFCGAALARPFADKKSGRLHVRRIEQNEPATLGGKDAAPPEDAAARAAAVTTATQMRDVLGQVHKSRTIIKGPNSLWAWVTFLLVAGLLVGWQYRFQHDSQMLHVYHWVRTAVGGIFWLMVIVTAFEDTMTQGMLCLLLPFYIVYYVFVRLEMYWLRGAFAGVFIGICMELYFMPSEALLVYAQGRVNAFIEVVSSVIVRASEPPMP